MTTPMAAPLTATAKSVRIIDKDVWYWRDLYLIRQHESNLNYWYVFKKFDEIKREGVDLLLFSRDMKSLKNLLDVLTEELPHDLVEELHPTNSN